VIQLHYDHSASHFAVVVDRLKDQLQIATKGSIRTIDIGLCYHTWECEEKEYKKE